MVAWPPDWKSVLPQDPAAEPVDLDPWGWAPEAWAAPAEDPLVPWELPEPEVPVDPVAPVTDEEERAAREAAESGVWEKLADEREASVPDAISGGEAPGPAQLPGRTGLMGSGVFATPELGVPKEGMAPESAPPTFAEIMAPPTPEEEGAYIGQLVDDPLFALAENVKAEQEKGEVFGERRLEEIHEDRKRLRANERAMNDAATAAQEQYAEIDQEARTLAETEPDRERWWSSRSAGQKFAGFLSAAIHGWLSPGQPNQTVKLISDQIDRDVALQQSELERKGDLLTTRQGLVARRYAQSQDLFRAAEESRLAMRHSVEEEMVAQYQLYDPHGTRAREMAGQISAWRAQTVAHQEDMQERLLDRSVKVHDMQMDEANLNEKIAARRAGNALQRRGQNMTQRRWKAEQDAAAQDPKRPPGDMEWLGLPGFAVPDKKLATEFRNEIGAVTVLDGKLAVLEELIHKYGEGKDGTVSMDRLGTEGGQLVRQAYADVQLAAKDALNMGANWTESEMAMIESAFTADPTKIRNLSVLPVVRSARDGMATKINDRAEAYGYKGPKWAPRKLHEARYVDDIKARGTARTEKKRESKRQSGYTPVQLYDDYTKAVRETEAAGTVPVEDQRKAAGEYAQQVAQKAPEAYARAAQTYGAVPKAGRNPARFVAVLSAEVRSEEVAERVRAAKDKRMPRELDIDSYEQVLGGSSNAVPTFKAFVIAREKEWGKVSSGGTTYEEPRAAAAERFDAQTRKHQR